VLPFPSTIPWSPLFGVTCGRKSGVVSWVEASERQGVGGGGGCFTRTERARVRFMIRRRPSLHPPFPEGSFVLLMRPRSAREIPLSVFCSVTCLKWRLFLLRVRVLVFRTVATGASPFFKCGFVVSVYHFYLRGYFLLVEESVVSAWLPVLVRFGGFRPHGVGN